MGCRVMGILNVTADSFSDGGMFLDPTAAIAHGRALAAAGADFVDVGGESTRPGAQRVSGREELARVLPVVTALADDGIAVSVDTMRASVAAASLEAGATLINDVSGGLADPDMPAVIAGAGCRYVVMHWRAHSTTMQNLAVYDDVVTDVIGELSQRVSVFLDAGVSQDQLILDPGLGFAKLPEHNWELLQNLDRLLALGFPLLIGASRKRFLGELLGTDTGLREPAARDDATTAITALVAAAGVWGVRVHDVRASVDAVAVVRRWAR